MKNLFIFFFALVSSSASAQSNNALHFDGANDQVYVGNSAGLNTPHITVQAWIKMDNPFGYFGAVTKRNCCNDFTTFQWSMQTSPDGRMSWAININHPALYGAGDPDPVPAGVWTNYTGTFDGHIISLYRNGILVSTNSSDTGNIVAMSWPFMIGARDGFADHFPGTIDEVRIWDHALTQDEILSTLNCELTGNESGLIAYYNFNEGVPSGDNQIVTTLTDLSPNHLDGALQNFGLTGATSNWVASGYPTLYATISVNGSTTICKPSVVMLSASPASSGLTYQWKKGNTNLSGATSSTYVATKTGTYECVVTNACGSATSNSISVTVNPQPTATITPSGTVNMCAGQTTVLAANAGNNLSYQWMKGANLLSGATNQTYSATTKGNYKVIVTNSSTGCSKTSKATMIKITCKQNELQVADNDSHLSIFPNPSDGKFSVQFSSDKTQDAPATIQFLTVTGQLMFEENTGMVDGQLQQEISFPSTLPDGIYLLQLQVNDEVYRGKMVLEK